MQSSCQTSFSSIGRWCPRSLSTPSFHYQGLSNEVTESDSSSTSERIMDSDPSSVNDVQEQELCDIKHIL